MLVAHMRKGSTSFGACEVRCWRWFFGSNMPVSRVANVRSWQRDGRNHRVIYLRWGWTSFRLSMFPPLTIGKQLALLWKGSACWPCYKTFYLTTRCILGDMTLGDPLPSSCRVSLTLSLP